MNQVLILGKALIPRLFESTIRLPVVSIALASLSSANNHRRKTIPSDVEFMALVMAVFRLRRCEARWSLDRRRQPFIVRGPTFPRDAAAIKNLRGGMLVPW